MQQIVEFNDPDEEPIVLQYPDFQVFATASSHAYGCRCFACRDWWLGVGPEDNGKFGPFGLELWDEYAAKHKETVREMKLRLAANVFFMGDEIIFPDEFTTEELEERVLQMIAELEKKRRRSMPTKICPFKQGKGIARLCSESACALWVESSSMCAIKLQAEMAARTTAAAERQVRDSRRTVSRGKGD